ncbi:hypothetical protein WJU23_08555 [Prosthecobacter sp. SYSU 5D2]|uniref:hypothetical protein n=1 Tax=Prosthecobacter sp. SYSU 5D2 TaxID=3134134 RepID=UPI0031FE701E
MSAPPTFICEFRTDTASVKVCFLRVTAFAFASFFLAALIGGRGWQEALAVSIASSAIMLAILWLYGIARIFGRRYVVASDGISLFRDGHLVTHILWSEVRSIRRGHLQVCTDGGTCIVFNLPPPIQMEARQAIEAFQHTNANG